MPKETQVFCQYIQVFCHFFSFIFLAWKYNGLKIHKHTVQGKNILLGTFHYIAS